MTLRCGLRQTGSRQQPVCGSDRVKTAGALTAPRRAQRIIGTVRAQHEAVALRRKKELLHMRRVAAGLELESTPEDQHKRELEAAPPHPTHAVAPTRRPTVLCVPPLPL